MNLNQFMSKHGNISFSVEPISTRPDKLMLDLRYHYKCKIGHNNKYTEIYFSCGPAITEWPSLSDVLDSVQSICRAYDDFSYDEFCKELGYEKSREASKVYGSCRKTFEKMSRLFGNYMDDFLFELESE